MPQHFRLSKKRRNLSLPDLYNMNETECRSMLAKIRWGSPTEQTCPECGSKRTHIYIKTRRQWKCKDCEHRFSIVSGSILSCSKISAKQILISSFMYCNAAKGVSAVELSALLGVNHKTAWLLQSKIREGILRTRDESKLRGMIHMDGGYFGGKRRHGRIRKYKTSHKAIEAKIASKGKVKPPLNPIQRRNWAKRIKNRRLIYVIREVSPFPEIGATRTIVAIARSESESDVRKLANRFIEKGSTIWTDEHKAYKQLSKDYIHKSVEHSKEFMSNDGVHNNHAESYFSRFRRAEYGTYHGFRPQYMLDYANEAAWREDMRTIPLKEQVETLLQRIFLAGESAWWRGYYQGKRREDELFGF